MAPPRPERPRTTLRGAAGSWLQGPPPPPGYPGERLGLPRSGRGSLASLGQRAAALAVDLMLASALGWALVRPGTLAAQQRWNLVSVGLFVLTSGLLAVSSGRTAGMRLMHLQIVRLDGGTVGLRVFFRQLLVALLVPALIWNRDQRGLPDRACNTAVVRVR